MIGLVVLLAVIAGIVTLGVMSFVVVMTLLRGITRLRFSLRSMMITVLCGGLCATLLAQREHWELIFIGLLCSVAYVTVIVLHLLDIGGRRDDQAEPPRPEEMVIVGGEEP